MLPHFGEDEIAILKNEAVNLGPVFCIDALNKQQYMEKKLFGIILTVLGIAGLIAAAVNFVNTKGSNYNVKLIIVFGILGAIFFFTGVGLIKNTKDRSA
jgi:uncharacterized membrane protein